MIKDLPIPPLSTLQGKDERVLIIKSYKGNYTAWHPILSDLQIKTPRPDQNVPKNAPPAPPLFELYGEAVVTIKVKELVPLIFEAHVKKAAAAVE